MDLLHAPIEGAFDILFLKGWQQNRMIKKEHISGKQKNPYFCLYYLKCIKNTFAIIYAVINKAVPLDTQCINKVCPICITFKSDDYTHALK